jgi:hypothetical protein
VVGSCEHGNECLGSTKSGKISRQVERLSASRKRLWCMKLICYFLMISHNSFKFHSNTGPILVVVTAPDEIMVLDK